MCFARESRQLYKCHIHPASGRVFCYNNSREKKKFRPMKTFIKVVLGIIAYKQITGDFGTPFNRRKPVSKTGTRTNMARSVIPNNGGR